MRRRLIPIVVVLALATFGMFSPADAGSSLPKPHLFTVKLKGGTSHSEPRISVGHNNYRWVVTNDVNTNDAIVFRSKYGRKWHRMAEPAGQNLASIDTDIITLPGGRIIATELDYVGINFVVAYSDDYGKTWTETAGARTGDTDRQWLAPGPGHHVYLMYHNLASGAGNHNMYVQTSTDDGASFGPPVPITLPGSRAYLDLQCADSGGPSNIFTNPKTGQIYAVWGSRSSVAGGCAAQPPEANVVAATEVWVATSMDGSPGSWTDHLAVDDTQTGKIVGMQLSPGTIDRAGNVYVSYPESVTGFPDYHGAAVKYVWAPGDLSAWSKPVTVRPPGGAGNVLVHIIAGDPGKLDLAYFHGVQREGKKPVWFTTVSQVFDGLGAHPRMVSVRVSRIATATGTASELMGACDSPGGGFTCDRSADVWGIALTHKCRLTITWPTQDNNSTHPNLGTFVSTQDRGRTIC
jgi:hypothetical protein